MGGVLFIVRFLLVGFVESGTLSGAFFESRWGEHALRVPVMALLTVVGGG